MPSPISSLLKDQQQKLFKDLNYPNMAEIKALCKRHSIPYRIAIQTKNGERRRTSLEDRKGIILSRIRDFLRTGTVPAETLFRAEIVCFDPLPKKLTPKDKVRFGQYLKHNIAMNTALKALTDGKFRDGAIARIVAVDFWTRGIAPTLEEFASAWLKATKDRSRPNPEWAYLSDRASKSDVTDWKKLRNKKARDVIKTLDQITRQ